MEEFAAIIACVMVFGIPIVAILTHHQRKMAEIIHSRAHDINPVVVDEVNRLRGEVDRLRQELHETTIALDDMRRSPRAVEQRIREGS
jgi:hypothetical protein